MEKPQIKLIPCKVFVKKCKDKGVCIISMQPLPTPAVQSNSRTKKNKRLYTNQEKSNLWNVFDANIHNNTDSNPAIDSNTDTSNSISVADTDGKIVYSKDTDSGLCGMCGSILMIMEDGFPTCSNSGCGIIYKTLDYSPEWRYYGADDKNSNDPTRCGNPINPLLMESSFGCKVLCNSRSSYEMKKIRKWTEWQSMTHREKTLYDEFQFITTMAQNAGISKIFIDDAMAIHKYVSEQQMFRGLNRDGIKAASIYISCRLNGCPRTAHEIAEIFHLDKQSATNGCSMSVDIMNNIDRNTDKTQATELCETKPSVFIERYCSKLNVGAELTMLCSFIAKKIENGGIITDNAAHAIAAGIVYFVANNCGLNITKTDIKGICGICEVTINKCFKKMEAIKTVLIPKCILEKYA